MAGAGVGAERPFIGRPEAVDALRRRSDAARLGRGGLTVLEGEAGVGKSTLVDGLVRDGRSKGIVVLLGRARALDNPPPYLLLKEALETGGAAEAHRPPARTGGLSALAFAPTAFDEPSGVPARHLAGPESWLLDESIVGGFSPSSGSAEEGRQRYDQYLARAFLERGDRAPTMLVLEDVQFADEGSLQALQILAPQLETRPLWVVLTRHPLATLPGPRRAALEAIERATETERVVLRPFTSGEAEEFVRRVAGAGRIPEEEITRWHSQSGGNPAFLEQLVRRRDRLSLGAVPSASEPVPEYTEFLLRQLADLPASGERVLAVAAVLGREFPFALLLLASDENEETLAELVQELVGRGVLRERPDEELEFPRDELRLQLYQRLTEARRRLLHKRVAEALEVGSPVDPPTVYALARHCYLARMDEKAVAYNRLAAEMAVRSFAPLVAREHLERVREVLGRLERREPIAELETAVELAVVQDRLGQLDQAEQLLVSALGAVAAVPEIPTGLRAFAQVCLARIYSDQGRWEDVDRITHELSRAGPEGIAPGTLLALHRLRGEYLYYRGRYAESLAEHDLALALARAQNDARETALERVRRANVLGMIPGRFEEADRDYREVIAELIERGDQSEAAFAQLFYGVVLSQNGRTEEGLVALHAARASAEAAHDPRRLGWALFDIADLERERGNLGVAAASNEEARKILERIGDRYGLVQTHIIQGKIRLDAHELGPAELALLEAYRLVRELNVPADEVEVLLRLAELALARSDRAQASSRAVELDRLGIVRLRPDLADDYERFRHRLDEGGTDPAA